MAYFPRRTAVAPHRQLVAFAPVAHRGLAARAVVGRVVSSHRATVPTAKVSRPTAIMSAGGENIFVM